MKQETKEILNSAASQAKVSRFSECFRPLGVEGYQVYSYKFYEKGGEVLAEIRRGWLENKRSYTSDRYEDVIALDFIKEVRRALKPEPNIKKGGVFYVPVKGSEYESNKQCDLYIDVDGLQFENHGEHKVWGDDETNYFHNFYSIEVECTQPEPYINEETDQLAYTYPIKTRRILFTEAHYSKSVKTKHGEHIKEIEAFMKDCGFSETYHIKEMFERKAELIKLLGRA